VALGRVADGLAGRASLLLAVVLRAANAADGALAVHCAFRAGGLFASHLALRTRADRMAHSGAGRVIALPAALGVALLSSSQRGKSQHNKSNNQLHGGKVRSLLQ